MQPSDIALLRLGNCKHESIFGIWRKDGSIEETNIDAISASEAAVARDPKKEKINPYTRVEGPPLTKPP